MEITDVDVVGRRIPFSRSFPVSYEAHTHTEHAFVRVRTDDGTEGFGEGTALPWFTGETTAGMVETLRERIAPTIVGASLPDAAATLDEFANAFTGSPGATSAAETALLDLRAKEAGVPVRELLGPTFRTEAAEVYPVPGLSPDEAATVAGEAATEGYRRFKVKATGDVDADVDRIDAVLNAVPADATARVDPNTSWETAATAVDAVGRLDDPDRIEYLEQPVAPDREDGLRRVWEETGIPTFADEAVHTPDDVERLGREGTVAGVCLKLAKLGTPSRLYRAGRRAADHGLDVTVVSAFGTSLEAAVNLHLLAALPSLSAGCEVAPMFLESDPVAESLPPAPTMTVPDGPGLGVSLAAELFE